MLMAILMSGIGYKMGHAPFCAMDDYGNLQCYYHTLSSCRAAVVYDRTKVCVRN